MTEIIVKILLWLFVINLGIAFGSGLYETRIAVPEWLNYSAETGYFWNAEAAKRFNVGLRFWIFVTTIPLTLLTVLSLIFVWQTTAELRFWWLISITAILADRLMTFFYFIPTMIRLMENQLPQSEAIETALQWINLGYVRSFLTLLAWLTALQAFSFLRR